MIHPYPLAGSPPVIIAKIWAARSGRTSHARTQGLCKNICDQAVTSGSGQVAAVGRPSDGGRRGRLGGRGPAPPRHRGAGLGDVWCGSRRSILGRVKARGPSTGAFRGIRSGQICSRASEVAVRWLGGEAAGFAWVRSNRQEEPCRPPRRRPFTFASRQRSQSRPPRPDKARRQDAIDGRSPARPRPSRGVGLWTRNVPDRCPRCGTVVRVVGRMAGAEGFEPSTYGFGDRRSTS